MKEWNTRCPLQGECGYKCKYHNHELDCSYYRANTRPGYQIEDQEERWQAEMDAYNAEQPASAEAAADGNPTPPITGLMTSLPVSRLHPHPDNPRKDLGDLTELADSIRANGIFQNLTVIPSDENYEDFTVVIGHRRLAAAKLAGLTEVPCVITQMTVKEQMQTMLLENMQRSELTVYEQAQGFQMMLDLGSTVEEIAEKSGFSVTTVRRRVKMMELDQDILKEVSDRQLSLLDFDKLSQIEDIAARNECLSKIGTPDFSYSVSSKLRQQAVLKKLPIVKALLEKAGAKPIEKSERYSPKYEMIIGSAGGYHYIADWEEGSPLIPEHISGQLYYLLSEAGNANIAFYQWAKQAEAVKRSAEEMEWEKDIAETWARLDEKTAVAYGLRSSFVKGLTYNKRNAEQILRGALIVGVVKTFAYLTQNEKGISELLDLNETVYGNEKAVKALISFGELEDKRIPNFIYTLFNDDAKESYASGWRRTYPEHRASAKLNGLYDWLVPLGYEMSEEEKALRDGTHELFHHGQTAAPVQEKEADGL